MITLLTKCISADNEIITLLTKFGFRIKVIRCLAFFGPVAENLIMVTLKKQEIFNFLKKYLLKIKPFQIKTSKI